MTHNPYNSRRRPYRQSLVGRVSKEELARRYEENRALAEKLIKMRLQAVAEMEAQEKQAQDKQAQDKQSHKRQVPQEQPSQKAAFGRAVSQKKAGMAAAPQMTVEAPRTTAGTSHTTTRPPQSGTPKATGWPVQRGRPAPTEIDAISRKLCHDQVANHLSEWGRCIRYRRMRRNVTAQLLSEQVGVSLSTLRRMERGDVSVSASSYLMTLASLCLLGELLQEPAEYLLDRPYTDGRLNPTHYPRARIRKWERRSIPF